MQNQEETTTVELADFIAKLLLLFDEQLDEGDVSYLLQEYFSEHGVCSKHIDALMREIDLSKTIPLTHDIH